MGKLFVSLALVIGATHAIGSTCHSVMNYREGEFGTGVPKSAPQFERIIDLGGLPQGGRSVLARESSNDATAAAQQSDRGGEAPPSDRRQSLGNTESYSTRGFEGNGNTGPNAPTYNYSEI